VLQQAADSAAKTPFAVSDSAFGGGGEAAGTNSAMLALVWPLAARRMTRLSVWLVFQ
jgi:hypothetical protein